MNEAHFNAKCNSEFDADALKIEMGSKHLYIGVYPNMRQTVKFTCQTKDLNHEPTQPKKLLLTKWTAVKPVSKQTPFWVCRVIEPELPTDSIEQVDRSRFSTDVQVIAWRKLQDLEDWRQGLI